MTTKLKAAAATFVTFGVLAAGTAVTGAPPTRPAHDRNQAAGTADAFVVRGAVAKPRRIPLTESLTALDAINYAGGLTATASTRNIRLVRHSQSGSGRPVFLPIDLAGIMKGDARTNYRIEPGDQVCVDTDPEAVAGAPADLANRLKEVEWKLEQVLKMLEESKVTKK